MDISSHTHRRTLPAIVRGLVLTMAVWGLWGCGESSPTIQLREAGAQFERDENDDDKIVTVSTTDPFYRHVKSLDDIPASLIQELTYFFENYKRAEGKTTKVERWEDVDDAKKIITWAQGYYKDKGGI